MTYSNSQKYAAELIGAAFLLAAVVGSGIMAERLASGNVAIALLGNTLPTGAILVVLITMLAPISGAHFNPAVTFVFALKKAITPKDASIYIIVQIIGAIIGVWAAHLMFDVPLFQFSEKLRSGSSQGFAEIIATFGLIFTILATLKFNKEAVAMAVGLYITSAYWFTASTSFANPAVTIARSLTDSFAGIRLDCVPQFILAEFFGAILALIICNWLLEPKPNQ